MITEIHVKNFKSLDNVTIKFEKFNCFVGINGAGKTTVLQLIDFLAQQSAGNISNWLENRGWKIEDIPCRTVGKNNPLSKIAKNKLHKIDPLTNQSAYSEYLINEKSALDLIKNQYSQLSDNITTDVYFEATTGRKIIWSSVFSISARRNTLEYLSILSKNKEHIFFGVINEKLFIFQKNNSAPKSIDIFFNYEGSVFSFLKDRFISNKEVLEFRNYLFALRSLDLIEPNLMRKSQELRKNLVSGGENLVQILEKMQSVDRQTLLKLLKKFYPKINSFDVIFDSFGRASLFVQEKYGDELLTTEAKHLNDGLLRILAILAQENSDKASLILLDEIENGVNPQIIETLIDTLVESKAQIIVTTHSPMILNYLYPEVARKSVHFVYKNNQGQTRVRRFFDLSTGKKLDYMGPGEAFVDTDLVRLTEEAVQLDEAEQLAAKQHAEQANTKNKGQA